MTHNDNFFYIPLLKGEMDSLALKLEFDDEFSTTAVEGGGEDSQTTTPVKPVKPKRERKEKEPGL